VPHLKEYGCYLAVSQELQVESRAQVVWLDLHDRKIKKNDCKTVIPATQEDHGSRAD
jgi:hypothetical protein